MTHIKTILDITLSPEEVVAVQNKFRTTPGWDKIKKDFPSFGATISNLPSFNDYRKPFLLHEMLLDAICEAKGWKQGTLSHLI